MYTENQPAQIERPKTGHGRRRMNARQEAPAHPEAPARPVSRRSRAETRDEESLGRPVSRVGFSPESSYR